MSWPAAFAVVGSLAVAGVVVVMLLAGDEVLSIVRAVFGRDRR